MREPPALAEDRIVGALETSFGIRVAALAFLPVGDDAASWAYRVQVPRGPSLFLKVCAGAAMPGAAVEVCALGAGDGIVLLRRAKRRVRRVVGMEVP